MNIEQTIEQLNSTAINNQLRGHDFYDSSLLTGPRPSPGSFSDRIIIAHFFGVGCDFFITKFRPSTGIAFGFINLGTPEYAEWGTVYLREVEELMTPVPVVVSGRRHTVNYPIERDLNWKVKSFRDVRKDYAWIAQSPFA